MTDRLITVRSFDLLWEADLCALFLEQEGIRAFVTESRSATIDYFWSNALGGIKLQIADSDLEKARQVLGNISISSRVSRRWIKIYAMVVLGLMVGQLLLGLLRSIGS